MLKLYTCTVAAAGVLKSVKLENCLSFHNECWDEIDIHKIKLHRNSLQKDDVSKAGIYFVDAPFPVADYFNIAWVNNNSFIGKFCLL